MELTRDIYKKIKGMDRRAMNGFLEDVCQEAIRTGIDEEGIIEAAMTVKGIGKQRAAEIALAIRRHMGQETKPESCPAAAGGKL